MSYAGKVRINNVDSPIASALYGTCTTLGNYAAKVVSLSDFDELMAGVTIAVKFSQANTAANPTLNVNGTGDVPIYAYGSTVPGITAATSWANNSIVTFTYDGSAWCMNDMSANNAIITMLEGEVTTEATARAAAITQVYARIAKTYSSSDTYRKNELVIYNENLYRCNDDITVAEAWTAAHWTATTVGAEREYKMVFTDTEIGIASSATATAGDGNTGILTPSVDVTKYETLLQTGTVFTYGVSEWTRSGALGTVDPADYGVTWPTEGDDAETPQTGDTITITYDAGTYPFIKTNTYTDYPFCSKVSFANVTEDMVAEVIFGMTDAVSGMFAPVVETHSGELWIFATQVPPSSVTIPTIIFWG